jgi:hypothetical protein
MSDPQANAEQLDEEELPEDLVPDDFIEPEDWDAGAGASEKEQDDENDDIGQEHEAVLNAEDAAMHIEQGNAEG